MAGLGDFCVEADDIGIGMGVPVLVDRGTSGVATFDICRRAIIDHPMVRTRVLAFIDPNQIYLATGDFICHKLGIANDLRNLDEDALASSLERHADVIVGLKVNIEFDISGRPGAIRHHWMTAAPVDAGVCRSYRFVARNDEHDRPDAEFLDFQQVVLDEDRPLVCNQVPPEIPLDPSEELHVKADRVSLEYRRWLHELVDAASAGPEAVAACLGPAILGPAILGPAILVGS